MFLRELIANYSARDSAEATFQAVAHWTNSIFLEAFFYKIYTSISPTKPFLARPNGKQKATITWTFHSKFQDMRMPILQRLAECIGDISQSRVS